jgi:transposase-like protein
MSHQQLLQGFQKGTIEINAQVSVLTRDRYKTYFVDEDSLFSHRDDDRAGEVHALAILMSHGYARPVDIERSALGIPHRTLMNWQRKYEGDGGRAFYRNPVRRGGVVITPEVAARCAQMFVQGLSIAEVARQVGIGESTLRKAIKSGRVPRPEANQPCDAEPVADKSARSRADAQAAFGMGMACTRPDERVAAAMGLFGHAATRFERNRDVLMGGLLVGLPALCANGLFAGLNRFIHMREGFYGIMHLLALMGFMALGRIRRAEGLRVVAPGEIGKVLGLDRVPEVKTFRRKVANMAKLSDIPGWMHECSRDWMEAEPDEAGYLYVDGHVRVYTGSLAAPPRRFVSRQRLCLRGTTDYWVNDARGRPFFFVSKTVTDGLAAVLQNDIVPALLREVPRQPSEAELAANPLLHRFVIVFDREGASPALFKKLWEQRIAAITYRKAVKELWPETEFVETEVESPGGKLTKMLLASRMTTFDSKTISVPVLEVRCLSPDGHQTPVISTLLTLEAKEIAARMFTRWCQENYFKYMMQHFDLDGLIQYGIEEIPGTFEVLNPAYKALGKAVDAKRRARRRQQARLGIAPTENDAITVMERAEMLERLQHIEADYKDLLKQRRETPKKIKIQDLPEEQKPTALKAPAKMLVDIVKMIAYRAETALVAQILPLLGKEADARALIRQLLVSSADIEPNSEAKTLTIRVHRMSCSAHDTAVAGLFTKLNALEFAHPQTAMRMVYEIV